MGRKRLKCGSDSLIGKNMADTNYQDFKDSIDSLNKVVSEGFATIHSDMDKLRNDFKADLDKGRGKIRELASSLSYIKKNLTDYLEKPSKLRSTSQNLSNN